MKLRELKMEEVEFTLETLEEDIPVRGNAIASDDEDYDREIEDAILARLEDGDIWAWCCVKVTAKWNGFEGDDYLGACSYANEEEFIRLSGYYDDMKERALDDLNATIEYYARRIEELIE